MSELSNAVTVLIARMESHPEDFELYTTRRGKFSGTAESLYGLAGLDAEKAKAFWFLTDADKEALIEAWKKYHRTAMEKEVMEKIFDDGEGERERVKQQQRAHINAQMARIGAAQQLQPGQIQHISQSAQNSYPYVANSAQQGSRGFLSGIFK